LSSNVRRVVVPGWAEPADVRERMFGDADWQVWLDAGPNASTNVQPGLSYLGAGRTRVVTASVERGTVTERILSNGLERTIETTIFEFVRGDLESHVEASTTDEVPNSAAHFRLGWVGWLGYELGSQTIGAPTSHAGISDEGTSDEQIPDACLIFLDRLIEFDHATQTIYALSFESDTGWSEEVASVVRQSQPKHKESSVTLDPISVTTRHSRTAYERLINGCLDEIRAGNAYQLCLTNRIDVTFAVAPDPVALYGRLRAANPTHHGGLIMAGGVSLLSSSPEVFLRATPNGHVTTKPIKGTRPRGVTESADALLANELRSNDKERAENLMIVDLMRNDLGRIAQVGSVAVEKLLDVESYANVHQLVSTVGADLASGLTAVDAIEACFPAGSMTGAPKLSAMSILNRLEAGPRGIYSGAFGYLSLDGACDLAMVIRSIVLLGAHASIGTGGGITSGSVPSAEWEETLVKAHPLLGVVGVTHLPA
jgi:aminodeoxychorismate synthase component I